MRAKDVTMKSISIAPCVIALALAAAMGVLAACSSDDAAAAPSRPPTPPPSTTPQGDGGDVDGGPSSTCFDATKTKPAQPADFLNQCNGAQCFPFDNGARIEAFVPGAPLPPLN